MNAPKVGELWRDKDKRELSGNRIVRIEKVEDGRVYYKHRSGFGMRLSSKLERFVKAFQLVTGTATPGKEE